MRNVVIGIVILALSFSLVSAESHSADIYVSSESDAYSVNLSTGSLTSLATYSASRGLALDDQGRLYVAASGTIHRIPKGGTTSAFVTLSNAVGLFFDKLSGNLFSANGGSNTISKITAQGTITTYASGLNGPRNLVMDNRGYLYVSNTNSNNIIEVDPNGTKRIFATSLSSPRGIAYGSDGFFYVANNANGTVVRIDTAGNVSSFMTGLSAPDGIAFDDTGNLYIVNRGGGNLLKRDPLGNVTTLSSLGGGQSIVIGVPEPSATILTIFSAAISLALAARYRSCHGNGSEHYAPCGGQNPCGYGPNDVVRNDS